MKYAADKSIVAAVIAGACTFLNVYCTQPLLPLLQRIYHASEARVSLTVGAVTLAVAVMAPLTGFLAETLGRKKVIVPALFAMACPTMLAATAPSLRALIAWRFAQGMFAPGVIAVMMAYINEEFPERAGSVMSAYVAGTVFGGFLGRFLAGLIATYANWRAVFIVLGVLDLAGAFLVRQWLPLAKSFVPARHSRSFQHTWEHLRNPGLVSTFAMGFTVLFSLVGTFTYVSFYLARPPFLLSSSALGSVFFVYLLGCVVTPLAGKFMDREGFRKTLVLALSMSLSGLLLTLIRWLPAVLAGLAVFSTGIFILQSAASVQVGAAAGRARSAAAGLYVTFYYLGGSVGAIAPAWCWSRGGWPACIALLGMVNLFSFALGLGAARKICGLPGGGAPARASGVC
jgi:predicted MFS family arabinose efflux permease